MEIGRNGTVVITLEYGENMINHLDTVNVVIFAGAKFRENGRKILHVGVIFTMLLIFPS